MTINEVVTLASMFVSVGMNVGLYIHLSSTTGSRLDSIERRMDSRFDSVERRLEMIQGDMHNMDIRLTKLEK
jgi:hypothetical protein